MVLSIVIFLIVSLGLGFSADLIVKRWKAGFLEKMIVRMGLGILAVSVAGVVFNHLRVPIHWLSFTTVAMILGLFGLRRALPEMREQLKTGFEHLRRLKLSKTFIYQGLALVLFIITLQMYVGGSFAYPWLEDGDPYGYAMQSKYIAEEMTYEADGMFGFYSAPYTQGYQIFMGILHQTNDSIYWTMKFFNALVISFSILFMYVFVRRVSERDDAAFWATFSLFAVPAWVSHFIFSLNFNMALMPVFLYTLFSIAKSKRWAYVAGLAFASIWINHFYTAVVMSLIAAVIIVIRMLQGERLKYHLKALFLGIAGWLVFFVPTITKHWDVLFGGAQFGGWENFLPLFELIDANPPILAALLGLAVVCVWLYLTSDRWVKILRGPFKAPLRRQILYIVLLIAAALILLVPSEKIMYSGGTASREYTVQDFFVAKEANMINNPIGIGMVLMWVFLFSAALLLYHARDSFKQKGEGKMEFTMLNIGLFTFVGVMGADLSIGIAPFRMWTFFGFFVSVIVGLGMTLILDILKRRKMAIVSLAFILLFVFGAYATSFSQKQVHNTNIWPEHWIMDQSGQAQQLFIWMRDGGIPKD
ncbi:MAG: hypothetical protein ACOC32_04925, partial [Nanoarchaeota archaeon]